MVEDKRDWVRGTYTTAGGKHCAMGALPAAAWSFDESSVLFLAHQRLLHVAETRGLTVERMNDRSTHADVLAAFDERRDGECARKRHEEERLSPGWVSVV